MSRSRGRRDVGFTPRATLVAPSVFLVSKNGFSLQDAEHLANGPPDHWLPVERLALGARRGWVCHAPGVDPAIP